LKPDEPKPRLPGWVIAAFVALIALVVLAELAPALLRRH
jgi:hypothetical protein